MDLHFLDHEMRKDKLDFSALLIPYLIVVCRGAPGLWKEFKRVVETAEQYAALIEEEGDR